MKFKEVIMKEQNFRGKRIAEIPGYVPREMGGVRSWGLWKLNLYPEDSGTLNSLWRPTNQSDLSLTNFFFLLEPNPLEN